MTINHYPILDTCDCCEADGQWVKLINDNQYLCADCDGYGYCDDCNNYHTFDVECDEVLV